MREVVESWMEIDGEIGVLKDALGLGVLLLIIASVQIASILFSV